MGYTIIEDFASGLDHRKSRLTAKPGSLRQLSNAIITPGGEIEKRAALTALGALPAGTHGLAFDGTNLVVFGTLAPGSIGTLPNFVAYRQLVPGDAETIHRVLDTQTFGGKIYAIARFSDGSIRHFYDGTLVPDTEVKGTNVRAFKSKMFCVDVQNLRFSSILSATNWTTGTGYGVIDTTTEDAATLELVGLEEYYGSLAVFGRTSVQIWGMDPDPAQSALLQVLGGIGLVAPNAVARYGSGDVLFLSNTGIRSLRARDASNSAAVNDIGSPVDVLVRAMRATLTPLDAERITALTDPLTGHYWLIWGTRVFVLAAYPNSKVTAWSTFDLPYEAEHAVVANSRVALRMGDNLNVYGPLPTDGMGVVTDPFAANAPIGDPAGNFDATVVVIETPFNDIGMPATEKRWQGLDLTCEGEWLVELDAGFGFVQVGRVVDSTWQNGRFPVDLQSTHIAVRLTSVGTGKATVSNIALHHDKGDAD